MKKKILLVEDNESFALAISMRLTAAGYTVIRADGVSTGMSKIVTRKPDLSLIDINLSDGNGFTLAGQIQSNPNATTTPLIFITASKNVEYRRRAQEYAPVAFLEKPFNTADLIEAIELSQYTGPNYRANYKRKQLHS